MAGPTVGGSRALPTKSPSDPLAREPQGFAAYEYLLL
jgi:hypothetical protein